jgi:hypothetical protein
LAIIKLKNGIDKYWRKHASDAISRDEKAEIRNRLLRSGIDEADSRLALQNALVIGKVARHDHPLEWPQLFDSLTQLLQQSAQSGLPQHLSRCLLIILHVTKELSTGRLQRTRVELQKATPEIFRLLANVYVDRLRKWLDFLRSGGQDEGGAIDSLDQSLLAIKVLRRLVISGFEFPNRSSDVVEFWLTIKSQFAELGSLLGNHSSELADGVRPIVEKHMTQFSKLHLEMIRTHPLAFALLPQSIEVVQSYWSIVREFSNTLSTKVTMASASDVAGVDDDKPLIEILSLKGILLLRECIRMLFKPLQTFKYRHQEEKDEQKTALEYFKSQLMVDSFVLEMTHVIVEKFFLFRPSDLAEWQEDPEEWERKNESEDQNWEYAVRPCAARLYLDLITHYKDLLMPPLLSVFESMLNPASSNILGRDAAYTAIGIAGPVLHQVLPFDKLLNQVLLQEVQVKEPDYAILRRRIAVLVGQWITIKLSPESRVSAYQIYRHLLDPSDSVNDLVVRVTAGKALKAGVDEWDFAPGPFLPYLPDILNRLAALVEEVEGTDTKLALLSTVSVIVERMGRNVRYDYADVNSLF